MRKATNLKKGDKLLLPFGKEATIIDDPQTGTKFVNFRTEWGPSRVEKDSEHMVEK